MPTVSSDPNMTKMVKEYLARFPYVYKIHRDLIYYGDIKEWCNQNFKKEYNEWFWWNPGRYDDHANLHIQRDQDNTLFLLKWGDKL